MIKKILRHIGYALIKFCDKNQVCPNLLGDRDIECSFIAVKMPIGPGFAFDFGTGGSNLGLIAARNNYYVTSLDLNKINWPYVHPHLEFIQGDLLEIPLPEQKFDLIISCSTIEHVGLSGRYNISSNKPDGDIEAMGYLKKLMKSDGCMLITIPVGKDAVFTPLHRVYGIERLPSLFNGYTIEHEEFWVKNEQNQWVVTDKSDALMKESQPHLYGLGCFVLRIA